MESFQVPLCDFLTRSSEWVEPEPDEFYKQITARLWGKGLTLRKNVLGSTIAAARQLRARTGQFLVSRIDARNGAFGIVPDDLDGALVSNDFPCFDIDARLVIPQYFEWYSHTPAFVDSCRRVSEGSTNRVRLKENEFLNMRISLPPLDEQRRLVARLDRVTELSEKRREAVAAADADMQTLLSKAFKRAVEGAPRRPMAEVAPLVRRRVEVEFEESYPELGVRSFGRGIFHKPPLHGIELTWQKLFRIEDGDLVFSNIKAWEGAFAVAGPTDHGRVGSHRYLTCVPIVETASARFLWYYLQTREGLHKIQEASPGSADRNRTLGQESLKSICVPVPSIDVQCWFDRLQDKVWQVRCIRVATALEIEALSSAVLSQVFGSNGPLRVKL